jgi:hypothetical protein
MMEQIATIDDFISAGVVFGISCADAARDDVAEKKSPAEVHAHVRAMISIKDGMLRQIGATDVELAAFMDAAGETAARTVLIAELFGSRNRHQRRARARQNHTHQ